MEVLLNHKILSIEVWEIEGWEILSQKNIFSS